MLSRLIQEDRIFLTAPGKADTAVLALRWVFKKLFQPAFRPTQVSKPVSTPTSALETGFHAGVDRNADFGTIFKNPPLHWCAIGKRLPVCQRPGLGQLLLLLPGVGEAARPVPVHLDGEGALGAVLEKLLRQRDRHLASVLEPSRRRKEKPAAHGNMGKYLSRPRFRKMDALRNAAMHKSLRQEDDGNALWMHLISQKFHISGSTFHLQRVYS